MLFNLSSLAFIQSPIQVMPTKLANPSINRTNSGWLRHPQFAGYVQRYTSHIHYVTATN
jgi:hypothetical protein